MSDFTRLDEMKNPAQKKLIAERNALICKDYKAMKRRHLDSDYIISQLSKKFFLSERWIWRVIREEASPKQTAPLPA